MHEHTLHKSSTLTGVMLKGIPDMIHGIKGYEGGNDVKAERQRRMEEGINVPSISVSDVLQSMKLERGNPARSLSQEEYYLKELQIYASHGGRTVCDCSPLLPDTSSLEPIKELSVQSKVHIITAAGYYTKHMIPKQDFEAGEEFMQHKIEQMIIEGDPHSGVKCGLVKCAVGTVENGGICPYETAAVKSAARTAKKYDLSLHIHTAFPVRASMILKLAETLEKEIQIDPRKVIFCHMDSYNMGMSNPSVHINPDGYDLSLPKELCHRGFNIGLDTWGITSRDESIRKYSCKVRKEMLLTLISEGYASQITLGHDMMSVGSGVQNHSSGYILWPDTLAEMKKEEQISENHYLLLTEQNAARILASDKI